MATGGPLGKVTKGAPLEVPADAYNAFVDAAEAHRRGAGAGFGDAVLPAVSQPLVALVRNRSGEVRGRFDVLGIDGVAVSPSANLPEFQRVLLLEGAAPTLAHHGRAAVLLAPVKPMEFGRALIDGVTAARVRMIDDRDRCADIDETSPGTLRSCEDGPAQILWVQPRGQRDVPTVGWAYVRLGLAAARTMQALITAYEEIGPNRWRYAWSEARMLGDRWIPAQGGYTQEDWGWAYNSVENLNDGEGRQGSGIDVDNLEGTFAYRPIEPGASVTLRGPVESDGEWRWQFSFSNNVDGECEP